MIHDNPARYDPSRWRGLDGLPDELLDAMARKIYNEFAIGDPWTEIGWNAKFRYYKVLDEMLRVARFGENVQREEVPEGYRVKRRIR